MSRFKIRRNTKRELKKQGLPLLIHLLDYLLLDLERVDTAQLQASLTEGLILSRNPASRFSFIRPQKGGVALFVDGEVFDCDHDDSAFAEQLCAQETMMVTPEASPAALAIIVALVNQGSVTLEPQG